MNVVFIVPTGLGCSIGGHAGDATPAFKLIASFCDVAVTHPNVVNASDINEMPENAWYVEGSILDRFLEGEICLERPKANKILLVTNKPICPETINAVNAARYTIGCEIEICELETPIVMIGEYLMDGRAGGRYSGIDEMLKQIEGYEFDALAMASRITVSKEVSLHYYRNGGVNPWGGIEAIVSKVIASAINKPFAHAPVETDDPDVRSFNEITNPRIAAEAVSSCYIHCVFKGLHRAPRISDRGLSVRDIDFLVTPWNCWGRPHEACLKNDIPILAVKENKTCLNIIPSDNDVYWVDNYVEAAGWLQARKSGIQPAYISDAYLDELE